MIGIVASGTGIGTMIVPPLAGHLILRYGWRSAYVILGILALVLITLAALFMRRDPHRMGERLYGEDGPEPGPVLPAAGALSYREMALDRQMQMVSLIYFCFGFSLHTVMVHLVPHAIEGGIPPETAAGLMAVAGGASVLSKLMVGAISDRIGVRCALAANFILLILALVWLQAAGSLSALRAFAFAFGFAYGGIMALQSVLSADLFGLSSLGLILGSVTFIYTIGSAVGPLLSSYLFDVTRSYRVAFLICALLDVLAVGVIFTLLGREGRKSIDIRRFLK
jgi:MFS family permease